LQKIGVTFNLYVLSSGGNAVTISRRDALGVLGGATTTLISRNVFAKPPVASGHAAIETYFLKLPHWDEFSPSLPDGPARASDPTHAIDNGQNCTTTEYTLAKNADKLVIFDPDRDVLWPGALVQGKGYAKGIGSLRELPIKKRAPLKLGISYFSNVNHDIVKEPSATSVNDSISRMIAGVINQHSDFGSKVSFTSTASYSAEQAMLELGISARYAGASMAATHKSQTSSTMSSVATYFIQNMFTIYVETPSTPADLFTNNLTIAELNEQADLGRLDPSNIPVYVSSISYGRILYVTTTAQASASDIMSAISASASSGAASASASLSDQQKKVLSSSQISITALGGPTDGVTDLIKSGRTFDYFKAPTTQQSVYPISFSFRNLSDLSLAAIRDTTTYKITECSAVIASQAVIQRTDRIAAERAEMFRTILGAVSNSSDRARRGQLLGWASTHEASVEKQLRAIQTDTIPDSDKAWIKNTWIPRFLSDLQLDISKAEREIPANSSDHGTASVWGLSLKWSHAIKTIVDGVVASI
jgi:Thiol-activated cytolysin